MLVHSSQAKVWLASHAHESEDGNMLRREQNRVKKYLVGSIGKIQIPIIIISIDLIDNNNAGILGASPLRSQTQCHRRKLNTGSTLSSSRILVILQRVLNYTHHDPQRCEVLRIDTRHH